MTIKALDYHNDINFREPVDMPEGIVPCSFYDWQKAPILPALYCSILGIKAVPSSVCPVFSGILFFPNTQFYWPLGVIS